MTSTEFFGRPEVNTYLSGGITDPKVIRPLVDLLTNMSLDDLEVVFRVFSPDSSSLTLPMRSLKSTVELEIKRKKLEPVFV